MLLSQTNVGLDKTAEAASLDKSECGRGQLTYIISVKGERVAWRMMDRPLRTLLNNTGKGFVNKWKRISPKFLCLLPFS